MAALQCSVDNQLIDFSDMHCSICTRTFSFALPSSVCHHTSGRKQREKQPEDDEEPPAKRAHVQNTKLSPRFKLRQGLRKIPRQATEDCNLAATHCAIKDTALQHKMDLYCKLCRGE